MESVFILYDIFYHYLWKTPSFVRQSQQELYIICNCILWSNIYFLTSSRQLQRELDMAHRSEQDLQKESQFMRKRLTTSAEEQYTESEVRRSSETTRRMNEAAASNASGAGADSAQGPSTTSTSSSAAAATTAPSSRAPERTHTTAVQQRRATFASPTVSSSAGRPQPAATGQQPFVSQPSQQQSQQQTAARSGSSSGAGAGRSVQQQQLPVYHQLGEVPAALGEAREDLQDVINALGVSPVHLGLGVNPRRSSVSGAYTSTTAKGGSQGSVAAALFNNYSTPGGGGVGGGESSASPASDPGSGVSGTSGASGDTTTLSIEKRFKALVGSALQSPVRLRKL